MSDFCLHLRVFTSTSVELSMNCCLLLHPPMIKRSTVLTVVTGCGCKRPKIPLKVQCERFCGRLNTPRPTLPYGYCRNIVDPIEEDPSLCRYKEATMIQLESHQRSDCREGTSVQCCQTLGFHSNVFKR